MALEGTYCAAHRVDVGDAVTHEYAEEADRGAAEHRVTQSTNRTTECNGTTLPKQYRTCRGDYPDAGAHDRAEMATAKGTGGNTDTHVYR